MKKSAVLIGFFPDSVSDINEFERALQAVRSHSFYDTVEFYFEGTDDEKKAVKSMLEKDRFSSVYLAGFPMKRDRVNLGDLDTSKRQYAIDKVQQLIDEAYYYGSEKMLFVSGERYATEEENERSFELLVQSVHQLSQYAENVATDYVLELCLEFFNDQGEPFYLLGPTEQSKRLIEQAQRLGAGEHLKLTFDLSHVIQLQEDPYQSLTTLWPFTRHIHLANCVTQHPNDPFYGDKHPPFGWANSDVDEDMVLDYVSHIVSMNPDNQVILGVEIITPKGRDRFTELQMATQIFKKALKK